MNSARACAMSGPYSEPSPAGVWITIECSVMGVLSCEQMEEMRIRSDVLNECELVRELGPPDRARADALGLTHLSFHRASFSERTTPQPAGLPAGAARPP